MVGLFPALLPENPYQHRGGGLTYPSPKIPLWEKQGMVCIGLDENQSVLLKDPTPGSVLG